MNAIPMDSRSDAPDACSVPTGTANERFEALMRASDRDVAASRPVIALIRAEDRLVRVFERALAGTGVTEVQFNVLMELAANDGRLAMCDLAQRLIKSPANVSSVVDRMERDGLARRVRGERDRRTVLVEITEAGWSALSVAAPAVFETERIVLADLPASDRAALAGLLDRIAGQGH